VALVAAPTAALRFRPPTPAPREVPCAGHPPHGAQDAGENLGFSGSSFGLASGEASSRSSSRVAAAVVRKGQGNGGSGVVPTTLVYTGAGKAVGIGRGLRPDQR
jgi:hypothetical protein